MAYVAEQKRRQGDGQFEYFFANILLQYAILSLHYFLLEDFLIFIFSSLLLSLLILRQKSVILIGNWYKLCKL